MNGYGWWMGGRAAESTELKSSPDAIKILRASISNECQQQHVFWLGRVLVAHCSWFPEPTEEQEVEKIACNQPGLRSVF